MIGWDSLLVLDLSLDIVDSVRWLYIKGDGLSSEGLDEDLHTSSESEYKVKSRLLLDVIVGECSVVLQLLSSED